MLHLDIKPENILVNFESGCQLLSKGMATDEPIILKLGDFGQARLRGNLKGGEEGDSTYMAPELLGNFNPHSRLALQDLGQQNGISKKKLKRTKKNGIYKKKLKRTKKLINKSMHFSSENSSDSDFEIIKRKPTVPNFFFEENNTSDSDFEVIKRKPAVPKFFSEKNNINDKIVNSSIPYLEPLILEASSPSRSSRRLFSPAQLGCSSQSSSPCTSSLSRIPSSQSVPLSPTTPSSHSFACDIFSFGLLLFKLCTNRALPKNGAKWQLIRSDPTILRGYLEKRTPTLSSTLISLISKMVSPNPKTRPSAESIMEVAKQHTLSRNS